MSDFFKLTVFEWDKIDVIKLFSNMETVSLSPLNCLCYSKYNLNWVTKPTYFKFDIPLVFQVVFI